MSSGVIGGAAAAAVAAAIAVAVGLVWLFRLRRKRLANRNSDTGSSDPSALVEWSRGEGRGGGAGGSGPGMLGGSGQAGQARLFKAEELERATTRFSEANLIGYGGFGSVYKGLLDDGTVVAIKRRSGPSRPEFSTEVILLSEIHHRNLVSLIGYCQGNGSQMLVFEYLPNGSVCNHLYHDTRKDLSTKLEFKQRVSIALGAAKGLSHLHGLKPPIFHKNFKTANILVDENLIAKVSDTGITHLVEKIEDAGSSRASSFNVFHDPEVGICSGVASEMSDVYSFGVFLLELVTGQEALRNDILGSNESLVQWVESRLSINNFVDHRMDGSFTMEGMRDLIRLTLQCMSFPGTKRPNMGNVVAELEKIQEKEMELTTVMGEGTATITLGSQLFS